MSNASHQTTPEERVARRREMFLAKGWPTSEEVAQRLHVHEDTPGQWARDRRVANELLGAWSPTHNGFVHPDFQFLTDRLNPRVAELLAALSTIPGFDAQGDAGGWRRVFWLYQLRSALSQRSFGEAAAVKSGKSWMAAILECESLSESPRIPADLFPEEPDAIIKLAVGDAKADTEPL
jgi:hypothetical protein